MLKILKPFGLIITREKNLIDYYLYDYKSYEEYRDIQIFHNKRKINSVFADEKTLDRVGKILLKEFHSLKKIKGICHGARNGFEQNYLRGKFDKIDAIGTDISETAKDYQNSNQWDFHDINKDWIENNEFVYTNSLDQSWQPKTAVTTWLSQLKVNGILIIEHTVEHGPAGTSEMDPFGVRPTVMPYILSMWFGSQISIEHSVGLKANTSVNAWLFVIKKNVNNVVLID